MIVEKNRKRIEVTEKAYRVVYAPLGFKPVKVGGNRGQSRSKKDTPDKDDNS